MRVDAVELEGPGASGLVLVAAPARARSCPLPPAGLSPCPPSPLPTPDLPPAAPGPVTPPAPRTAPAPDAGAAPAAPALAPNRDGTWEPSAALPVAPRLRRRAGTCSRPTPAGTCR